MEITSALNIDKNIVKLATIDILNFHKKWKVCDYNIITYIDQPNNEEQLDNKDCYDVDKWSYCVTDNKGKICAIFKNDHHSVRDILLLSDAN